MGRNLLLALLLLPCAHTLLPRFLRGRAPSPRAGRVDAKAPEFIFELAEDRSSISFGCRQQSLTMVKPETGGSLQEFIGSDQATIVMSSWDPGQVQRVEGTENEFLISVEEVCALCLALARRV